MVGCQSNAIQIQYGKSSGFSTPVSSIELIANGEKFNEWNVSVVSYFVF